LLLLELKAKGISDQDIQTALTTPNEQGQFSSIIDKPQDELSLAQGLAQKQARKYNGLDASEFKQKMSRFLASKGFDWDVINQVLKGYE
jgi:SOS response regulatory protein OraA/RecX